MVILTFYSESTYSANFDESDEQLTWDTLQYIRQIFVYTLFSEPSDIQKW
jgi:hypothetical protein